MTALEWLGCIAGGILLSWLLYEFAVLRRGLRSVRREQASRADYWSKLIGPDAAKGRRHLRVTREEDHD